MIRTVSPEILFEIFHAFLLLRFLQALLLSVLLKVGKCSFSLLLLTIHYILPKKKKKHCLKTLLSLAWCEFSFLQPGDHKSLRNHEGLATGVQIKVHESHNFFNWISGPRGRITNLLLGKLWTLPPPLQAETNSSPPRPGWAMRWSEPTGVSTGRSLLELCSGGPGQPHMLEGPGGGLLSHPGRSGGKKACLPPGSGSQSSTSTREGSDSRPPKTRKFHWS